MFSAGRVLLMPKGAYNPLTTYEMLDIVSYNGSSYIAKGTTTGNLPTDTTYWQLSAYGGQAANIAGNFAELESSSVATATHYVDDIFVDENSQLMKATQTINIGDTIDANVNCAPTTVEALIAYLSSYVDSLDSLNKKIQGAIEIAAQTDLHSLAIGEYYKKQTTFYVTNGPTGIDQDPTAIFRLTVEAALDNASQASSPLLLTLRTPDGKIYTQSFDGTNWGSWVEVASAASVSALNTAKQPKTLDTPITVGGVQQTTVEGALGSINQTLTNKVANEIATRAKVSGHNFVSMKLSPYKAQANNYVSIGTQTDSQLTFTTENHNYADVQLAYALPIGNYKASIGEIIASDSYTPIINIYFLDASGQNVKTTVSLTSNQTKDFEIDASVAYILISFLGTQGTATAAIRTVTFNNLMIRLATDESADYEPYSMTNQQMTPYVQAISNPNLLDNPWFTVNQRGQISYSFSNRNNYCFDRWISRLESSNLTITKKSNYGITLNYLRSVSWFALSQIMPEDISTALLGKNISVEMLLGDITNTDKVSAINIRLYDASSVTDNSTQIGGASIPLSKGVHGAVITLPNSLNSGHIRVDIYISTTDACTIDIDALKLELGSVSTLAQDTAPNYATELLKCQRYFYRHKGAYMYGGYFHESTTFRSSVKLPTAMRAIPSISFPDGIEYNQCGIYDAQGSFIAPSAVAVDNVNNVVGIPELLINSTTPTHTQYVTGVQRFNLTMDISADL